MIDDPEAPEQRAAVAAAPGGVGPFLVDHVVPAETLRVLGRRAGMPRGEIAGAVAAMLDAPTTRVDRRGIVRAALAGFRAGGGGFTVRLFGAVDRAAGCVTTPTFDRAAARSPAATDLA